MPSDQNAPPAPRPARGAPPAGGGGSRRLLRAVVVIGLAGGGYYAWRHYKETGHIVGMDEEESKELTERAKEFGEKAGKLLAESRELFQRRKADLEVWFKERDIKLPTRKELVAIADKYVKSDDGSAKRTASRARESEVTADRPPRTESENGDGALFQPPTAAGGPGRTLGANPMRARREKGLRPHFRPEGRPEGDPLVLGRREFGRGFEHWRKAPPNSPDEQRELKTARKHFTSARDYFRRAKETHPDDKKIGELVTDCNRFIYDCMKRTILDLH